MQVMYFNATLKSYLSFPGIEICKIYPKLLSRRLFFHCCHHEIAILLKKNSSEWISERTRKQFQARKTEEPAGTFINETP